MSEKWWREKSESGEEKRGTAVSQAAPSLPLSDLGCFSSAIHSESFRSTCWLNALTHYRAFEILWTSSFPVWRIFSPSLPSQCFSYCALSTIDWFNNLLFSLFVLDKTNSLPWYHNYSWGRKKSLDQWETADIQLTNYSFFEISPKLHITDKWRCALMSWYSAACYQPPPPKLIVVLENTSICSQASNNIHSSLSNAAGKFKKAHIWLFWD